MVWINLGLTQERATVAVRKGTVPPMMPAEEKKAIVTKTRRNGSSERWVKEVEKEKARAKEKEK